MNETTFSIFQPVAERSMQTSLKLSDPPRHIAYTEKYRPRSFSEIVGQSYAVDTLSSFVDSPYPQAFLFSGPSGVGKTSAAFAMARELNVNMDWNFKWVRSGELNDEEVTNCVNLLRFVGLQDGWKMIICDEADKMSNKARDRYLSILEALQDWQYDKSVIVFTTNKPESFEDRFLDRTEHLRFEGRPSVIGQDAQVLLNRLWLAEKLDGAPPSVERIPGITSNGSISFRRVVQFIQQEAHRPRKPAQESIPTPATYRGQGTVTVKARVAL